MKCENCGYEFEQGSYCSVCGAKCEELSETTDCNNITKSEEKSKKENVVDKNQKKNDRRGVWALILGIIAWVGLLTVVMPIVCGMLSIIQGIKALKGKTKHKIMAVTGILLSVLLYVVFVWALVTPSETTNVNSEVVTNEVVEIEEAEKITSNAEKEIISEEVITSDVENEIISEEIIASNAEKEIISEEVITSDVENEIISEEIIASNVEDEVISEEVESELVYEEFEHLTFPNTFNYRFSKVKNLAKVYEDAMNNMDQLQEVGIEKGAYKISTSYFSSYYFGKMKDGRPNGKGTIFEANNNGKFRVKYIGEFKDGKLNGWGVEFSEGAYNEFSVKYEGEFVDGKYEGDGILYLPIDKYVDTTTKYYEEVEEYLEANPQDTVLENCPVGVRGILYEGELKNGEYHGNGKEYLTEDILYYEGEYKKGKWDGKGTQYFLNSEQQVHYKGEFKNGEYDGKGTLYDSDGSVKYKGKFKRGKVK